MKFFLLGIVLVNLLGEFVASELTAVINTTIGPVQGEIRKTVHSMPYAAFKGIRYAQAPVGYLRFKPPVPVKPSTEILDATVDGVACPQLDSEGNVIGSEDCLFLTVCTPVTDLSQTPKALKSVMVWIYGGAFVAGSSSIEGYHPDFILERDVVFVSLNYRLGALGFLSVDHPNATGNAGLKDQNLALKWVQANIAKFGGNPKNVTIYGESAGAASVGYHVISDASAGLFHGAISMSGVPLNPWAFIVTADAVTRAGTLAALLGTLSTDKATLLKTFYAASVEDLVQLAQVVNPFVPFTPTLEDPKKATNLFLSECAIKKYASGNFSKVPQIVGFMQQETVAFLGDLEWLLEIINGTTKLADLLGGGFVDLLPQLDSLDGVNNAISDVSAEILEALVNVTTDFLFKVQIDKTQKLLVNKNGKNPIYYYDITFFTNRSRHNIEANITLDGAGHADDIAYIFYLPANNYNLSLDNPMGLTIYRVSTMWTNFAKYGNPTPSWVRQYPLNITWPASGTLGRSIDIGNELTVGSRPLSATAKTIETALGPFFPTLNGC